MTADVLLHALPWYFGAAVFVIWAAAMAGIGLLVARRVRSGVQRRANGRRTPDDRRPVSDDRSLGPGTDIEVW